MAEDVPYQSLYRRFRPQRFDELKGQDHVAMALKNAVRKGKLKLPSVSVKALPRTTPALSVATQSMLWMPLDSLVVSI